MKIKLELFGASRDFSEKDHLEFEIEDKSSVNDLNSMFKYKYIIYTNGIAINIIFFFELKKSCIILKKFFFLKNKKGNK